MVVNGHEWCLMGLNGMKQELLGFNWDEWKIRRTNGNIWELMVLDVA